MNLGARIAAVGFILLTVGIALALSQNIHFTPPTENTDGSQLLEQDLDFYTFYCDGERVLSFTVTVGNRFEPIDTDLLSEGPHDCELTVTALNGSESGPSNTITINVPKPPVQVTPPPTNPPPVGSPTDNGGGGGLGWLVLIFIALVVLITVRGKSI